jgi:hypothetical protein
LGGQTICGRVWIPTERPQEGSSWSCKSKAEDKMKITIWLRCQGYGISAKDCWG